MFGGNHVQTGAGRYFQYHGALKRLGEEAKDYGNRIFILYSDDIVKGKTKERIEESLTSEGLTFTDMAYEGPIRKVSSWWQTN